VSSCDTIKIDWSIDWYLQLQTDEDGKTPPVFSPNTGSKHLVIIIIIIINLLIYTTDLASRRSSREDHEVSLDVLSVRPLTLAPRIWLQSAASAAQSADTANW